jgi:protein-tyrosine-phosphatase
MLVRMSSSTLKHVLFVCTGNTCRSPMAEGLFRKEVAGRTDYEVGSAGVAASSGTPMNSETVKVLKRCDAELPSFASRPVTADLLEKATHVFAMTSGHLMSLERNFPEYADKLYLVCEFADVPGKGVGADVPDPIGMGSGAYNEVAEVLSVAIPALIAYIDQTSKGTESPD